MKRELSINTALNHGNDCGVRDFMCGRGKKNEPNPSLPYCLASDQTSEQFSDHFHSFLFCSRSRAYSGVCWLLFGFLYSKKTSFFLIRRAVEN